LMVITLQIGWDGGEYNYNLTVFEVLKVVISGLTALLVVLVIEYNLNQFRWDMRKYQREKVRPMLFSSYVLKLIGVIGLELMIILPHPFPYVRQVDSLGLLMFLRLYVLFRVIRDYHPLWRKRRAIWKNLRLMSSHNESEFSTTMIMRFMMKQNMGWVVVVVATLLLGILPYCFYIAERGILGSRNWLAWIYLTVITATTVGYGDIVPKTNVGRVISMITASLGVIMAGFVVALVMKAMTLSQMQEEAGMWVWERKLAKRHQKLAAEFIVFVWRHYVWKKRYRGQHPRRDKAIEARFEKKCLHYTTYLRNFRREKLWKTMNNLNYTRAKLKKMELKLEDLKQQSEVYTQLTMRANQSLDILCHVLSHHCNTPIELLPYAANPRS